MVSDADKKYREIFAYGLLGVAALYFISGLSLLFRAVTTSATPVSRTSRRCSATSSAPRARHRPVRCGRPGDGLGGQQRERRDHRPDRPRIGALCCCSRHRWLSAFGADTGTGGFIFNGVTGAGKVVGHLPAAWRSLALLGARRFYAFTVYQTFPKPVPAQTSRASGVRGRPVGQQQAQQGWAQQGGYDQGQASRVGRSGPGRQYGARRRSRSARSRGYAAAQGEQQQWPHEQGPGGSRAGASQQAWLRPARGPVGRRRRPVPPGLGRPRAERRRPSSRGPAGRSWGAGPSSRTTGQSAELGRPGVRPAAPTRRRPGRAGAPRTARRAARRPRHGRRRRSGRRGDRGRRRRRRLQPETAQPGETRVDPRGGAQGRRRTRRRSRAGGSSRPSSGCRLDHSRRDSAADLGFAALLHDRGVGQIGQASPFGSGRGRTGARQGFLCGVSRIANS